VILFLTQSADSPRPRLLSTSPARPLCPLYPGRAAPRRPRI